jgi:hypothetical protein
VAKNRELEPLLDEVLRHPMAHHPDTDEGDLHRVSDPYRIFIPYLEKIEYIFYDPCKGGFAASFEQ